VYGSGDDALGGDFAPWSAGDCHGRFVFRRPKLLKPVETLMEGKLPAMIGLSGRPGTETAPSPIEREVARPGLGQAQAQPPAALAAA
jgi:hypothetical protein